MLSALFNLLLQYRQQLTAFVLLVAALTLMLAVRTAPPNLASVRELTLDLFVPIQRVVSSPLAFYQHMRRRFEEMQHLDQENQELKQALQNQRPDRLRMMELQKENQRLRILLRMRPDPTYHTVSARVVGDASSAFSHAFTLHAGTDDGVALNAAVVAARGLIGRVAQVGRHSALALSIHDLNSRVPVLDQRSRVRGIASGTNTHLLKMNFVPKEADVQQGDLVITSGVGGIFPKGVVVGHIVLVEPHVLFQQVMIAPAADVTLAEEARMLVRQPEAPGAPAPDRLQTTDPADGKPTPVNGVPSQPAAVGEAKRVPPMSPNEDVSRTAEGADPTTDALHRHETPDSLTWPR